MPNINFLDCVVLRVIIEHYATTRTPPRQIDLWNSDGGLVNEWLERNGVLKHGRAFTGSLSGNKALGESIDRLRNAGLLMPPQPVPGVPAYQPTSKGFQLFAELGDDWTTWNEKISATV